MDTGQGISQSLGIEQQASNAFWYWKTLFNWNSSSSKVLDEVEEKIFSYLKTPHRKFFVEIGSTVGENDRIWTIELNPLSQEVPLVLLHGMGSGIALWILNLDELSSNRPVYAIDILGFGRSSRPIFSNNALDCEQQFVKSLEAWRTQMNINKIILLGHSMGGFLAASYALSYPEHLKHLILADPWGFPEKSEIEEASKRFPRWLRTLAYITTPFNLLFPIRAAGPFGKWLVRTVRPDIVRKFSVIVKDHNDKDLFPLYIHQCNAQVPTGEAGFHSMMEFLGCAKYPMFNRIINVDKDVPITFIYGKLSWIDPSTGERVKSERNSSLVDIRHIPNAGHHVYADEPEVFNEIVNEICSLYKPQHLKCT